MNADIKWLDNPEVFCVNQIPAHSDHEYYTSYADLDEKIRIYTTTEGLSVAQFRELLKYYPIQHLSKLEKALG